jgi:hypothetical protein
LRSISGSNQQKRQGHDEKAGEWDGDCNVPDGG